MTYVLYVNTSATTVMHYYTIIKRYNLTPQHKKQPNKALTSIVDACFQQLRS